MHDIKISVKLTFNIILLTHKNFKEPKYEKTLKSA